MRNAGLRNKKVLITAGPTWVAVDSVRVISNTASGRTGIILAEKLQRQGAKVTLLLGPGQDCRLHKKIRILRFKFFDQLRSIIKKELKKKQYDIVIHSAAVSDYRPSSVYRGKINSGKTGLKINLMPAPKIIDEIKSADPSVFLVGFKFEPGMSVKQLIRQAQKLLKAASCDLVVANTAGRRGYSAYIVEGQKFCGPISGKEELADKLAGRL